MLAGATGKRGYYLFATLVLKHLIQCYRECVCNFEGDLKRWGVLPLLNGKNGLPGDADGISQCLLGHFAVIKPQLPDVIGDRGVHFRIPADSKRFEVRNSPPVKRTP
jgi:hypothetical protein